MSFHQKLSSTPEKITKKVNKLKRYEKAKKQPIEDAKDLRCYKKINLDQEEGIIGRKVSDDISKNLDLSCLNTPNWLNDEVINTYLELLRKENPNVFMFTTFFFVAFSQKGFSGVRNYYRKHDILSFKVIFIPIHLSNHWFLITCDKKELVSFDPYNYPESAGLKKEHLLKGNRKYHESILTDLKENYFKPLFHMHRRNWSDMAIKVKTPPNIPAQNNLFDCGVFLLAFAKYMVFEKEFDFSNGDMRSMRNEIKREIVNGTIQCTFRSQGRRMLKRKNVEEIGHPPSALPRKIQRNVECIQRRFWNQDNEVKLSYTFLFKFV